MLIIIAVWLALAVAVTGAYVTGVRIGRAGAPAPGPRGACAAWIEFRDNPGGEGYCAQVHGDDPAARDTAQHVLSFYHGFKRAQQCRPVPHEQLH